jgi:predicted transcriptional regulator
MPDRYDMPLSDLQHDILEECCMNEAADYNNLSTKTGRGRTTLIQSINSLVKYGYIKKQKVNPGYEKSKLIFRPTYKGMAHAWNNMGMDAEDVLKRIENQTINNYIQHIKELPLDPRAHLFGNLAYTFLYAHGLASKKFIDAEANNIVKASFRRGLLETIEENPDYDARNLLTTKIKKWIKKTYSSEELKEFKEELKKIRNNIDSTIELFPFYD